LIAGRLKQAFPENPVLALHIAACATLTEGLPEQQALSALKVESEANNLGSVPNPRGFLDRLASWLPTKIGNGLGGIEPDIVGEAFVLGEKTPHLANPQATIFRFAESRRAQVVQFLIRATQDFCLAERESRTEPLEWLEQLITKGNANDLPLLLEIDAALPESSVVLRPYAVLILQMIVTRILSLVERGSKAEVPVDVASTLAWYMSRLANSLGEVGQHQQALMTAVEAVKLSRQLAEHNRDTYLPRLASGLRSLTIQQNHAGYLRAALETAQETVRLYEELAQRNPAFLEDFATSLNNLATIQSEVGERELALKTAQQATMLIRELVQRDRQAYLPRLAMSLNTLAIRQGLAKLREPALATAQEATALYRELAQHNRDAHLPDLGLSLTTLANRQNEASQHEAALESAQEAATLFEELAQRNRQAFLPDLAKAVNNLANCQKVVGQHLQALETARKAVSLKSEVARSNSAFVPDLAGSCANLGSMYLELQRYPEASQVLAEGLTMLLPTIEAQPVEAQPVVPHITLAVDSLRCYIYATRQGAIEPDQQLLTEVRRVLGPYLNQKGDSQ
jgi:tetratricopeptide (TPR) repeat protein